MKKRFSWRNFISLTVTIIAILSIFTVTSASGIHADPSVGILSTSNAFEMELLTTSDENVYHLEVLGIDKSTLKEITVLNEYGSSPINEAELFNACELALLAKTEEGVVGSNGQLACTYNFELITDDETYFYEELPDGDTVMIIGKATVYSFDEAVARGFISSDTQWDNSGGSSTRATIPTVPSSGDQLKGCRMKIFNHGTADYMTCTVQTPTKEQVVGINNSTAYYYIYTGWSSSAGESDIGLQYSLKEPSVCGWNHYFGMNGNSGTFVSGYEQVTGNNFFLTSTSSAIRYIYLTTYRNFSNTGYVRSKAEGYARYNNYLGTGSPSAYWLVSVKQYAKTVSSVTSWKWVNDIAGNSTAVKSAKAWSKVSELKLVTTAPLASNLTLEHTSSTSSYTLDSSNRLLTLTVQMN